MKSMIDPMTGVDISGFFKAGKLLRNIATQVL